MLSKKSSAQLPSRDPIIVPRAEHPVSRRLISANALKVLNRLHEGGFSAYLVGGGVRDVLVGLKPKDFDVATNASPEEVRALFRNSRIIGRRFRLVHVVYGRDIIEVATFRANHDKGAGGEVGASGRIVRDNVFGSIDEDARRRDFSVNALYYNIADHTVVDYVGGLKDIDARLFRLIGDPVTRCEEDPVRVLRAVRLASKLEFDIHPDTLSAMQQTAHGLAQVPPARMFEEVLKLFQGGYARRSFHSVREHELLQYLFPMLSKRLEQEEPNEQLMQLLNAALENTDRRVQQGKPITPAYLLAFMLWPDVEERIRQQVLGGAPLSEAVLMSAESVMSQQLKVISIPKRFSGPMQEIWQMQPRLEQWKGARALRMLENRRFRASYDFLCLRAQTRPELQPLAKWWTELQELTDEEQEVFASSKPVVKDIWGKSTGTATKKRRRRRPPKARGAANKKGSEDAPAKPKPPRSDASAPSRPRKKRAPKSDSPKTEPPKSE